MTTILDAESLDRAFHGRPDLQAAIRQAAVGNNYIELFNQISLHVCHLSAPTIEPACKRQKLEVETTHGSPINNSKLTNGSSNVPWRDAPLTASGNEPIQLEIKDISSVIPQRKKYNWCFTKSCLYARLSDSTEPVSFMSYPWENMERVFYLPVPEKAQIQHNYVIFPLYSSIPPPRYVMRLPPEPLAFTIPNSRPKANTVTGPLAADASAVSDSYESLFEWALAEHLTSAKNPLKIIKADPKFFSSAVRQPHRPTEKAVHVKAFRGSKDGYLFFLPVGIFWGFKKPLMFLSLERIASVAYTSVLQRTFNLSVEFVVGARTEREEKEERGEEQVEEVEFMMIDQEDFSGIDVYVKRYGLSDQSMAEQRKAKRLGINVVKGENEEVIKTQEEGELESAMREVDDEKRRQDEEDEEEEDYDPGSEGESEGEGSSSEEEEEAGVAGDDEVEDDDGEDNDNL